MVVAMGEECLLLFPMLLLFLILVRGRTFSCLACLSVAYFFTFNLVEQAVTLVREGRQS